MRILCSNAFFFFTVFPGPVEDDVSIDQTGLLTVGPIVPAEVESLGYNIQLEVSYKFRTFVESIFWFITLIPRFYSNVKFCTINIYNEYYLHIKPRVTFPMYCDLFS